MHEGPCVRTALKEALQEAVRLHEVGKAIDVPDHVVAEYLMDSLKTFEQAVRARKKHIRSPY